MILPSLNASNCGNILIDSATIPLGDNAAHRKNAEVETIRSQGSLKKDQGSTTKGISLKPRGMAKPSRMGQTLYLATMMFLFSFSTVQANMVTFRQDNKVFSPIVSGISVDVVNNFIGSQISSKTSFTNKPVFHDAIPGVFVRVPIGISHNVSFLSCDVPWVKWINELEAISPCKEGYIICANAESLSCFLGSHAKRSHFSERGNWYGVLPFNPISVHVIEDKFFGDTVLMGNFGERFKFLVVCPQLFRSDEELLANSFDSLDIVLSHPIENGETGNLIFFSEGIQGFYFRIIPFKMFFAKKILGLGCHMYTLSPNYRTVNNKVSRYSLNLFEKIGRQDKEPVDNILEIKNFGDKVYIRTIPDVTTFAYQKGMTLPKQRPESADVELLIDQGQGWNILLDDVDKVQSDLDLLNKWTGDAAKQLDIAIDLAVLAGVASSASSYNCGATAGKVSAGFNLGVSGAPVQVSKSNALDYVVDIITVLEENDVPPPYWAVFPGWVAGMMKKGDFKDAAMMGDPKSIVRSGLVGAYDNLVVYTSNQVATVAAATDTSGFKSYYALFGNKDAITFATQLTKTESLRSTESFDTIVRGLMVYGYKVVKGQALGYLYCRK